MKKVLVQLAIASFLLSGCADIREDRWSDLPGVTPLDNFKETKFVITMNEPASPRKNIVYAPAFMMAWDQITKELKSDVLLSNNNSEPFRLMNTTKHHIDALNEDEYSVSTEIDGDLVTVKAFFNKTLPFATKLQTSDSLLQFNGKPVSSFGMFGFDADILQTASLLFYEDDENFILKLSPRDNNHEIILAKGIRNFITLEEATNTMNGKIASGTQQVVDAKMSWKYAITEEDKFAIPVLSFNIDAEYKSITGEKFVTRDGKPHVVAQAYQRTAFQLNENGAVVESEALVSADSTGAAPPKPKILFFNSPFLLVVKRADAKNPYFVMWVANTELMSERK